MRLNIVEHSIKLVLRCPHPRGQDREIAQKPGNQVRTLRSGHLRRARLRRIRQGKRRDALQPPLPQDRQESHRHHHQPPLHKMGGGPQGQGPLLRPRGQAMPQVLPGQHDRDFLPYQRNEKFLEQK